MVRDIATGAAPDLCELARAAHRRGCCVVHCVPAFGREHDTDAHACWCSPEVQASGGGYVVVHREDN